MKTRKSLLTLALIAAASASSFTTSAATVNPEKDSVAVVPFNATLATAWGRAKVGTMPRKGEVSSDGLYVYSGSDRGWVARSHSYDNVARQIVHAADCLPYNAPKPDAAFPVLLRGELAGR